MACFYMQLSRYLLAYTGNQASIMRHDTHFKSQIDKPVWFTRD
ncbi:hypothetical protein ERICIV_04159 [Paenibacillus larvae subsp. larvae]|uniref:Uncharacterized protein n=1 Tax=Paenibacillus larvae subsp. larvae TaxID=147375 RepID=A0A2L1U6B3_9BACL|nr:hypothetical protein ERICIII_04415 [Paenibacillus larvae subsp. larvae]AVF32978.1 hypothetical protein ERICIV_04159 [Paenibacillus larvae subsp. larvae]